MLQMLMFSLRSFVRGKLFRDNGVAFRLWLKGFVLTLVLLLTIGYLVDLITGVVIASLVGGAVQPYLFKNIRYA